MTMPTVTSRFVHGLGFYRSDEEYVRTFAPFCAAGLEREESTIVRVEPSKADLLRDALGEQDGLTFLPHDEEYASPPAALSAALTTARRHSDGGQRSLRLLGELPPLRGLSIDAWLRYESAANHVLRDFPVLAVCPFDASGLSPTLQDDLLRLHHLVLTADGRHETSRSYEPPEHYRVSGDVEVMDPLEELSPQLDLADPSPTAARIALSRLAHGMRLAATDVDALLLAVSEVVTNALLHGLRPVRMRAWGRNGRVVVAVEDRGRGPDDPFAGLLPVRSDEREGGRGLWIIHQLCPEVALSSSLDGFTVRLAVGAAVPAAG
jgi:anti-sigma regulatory factor (Ser/Thr protein kinase)